MLLALRWAPKPQMDFAGLGFEVSQNLTSVWASPRPPRRPRRRDSADLKRSMSELEGRNRILAVNLQNNEAAYQQKLAEAEVCVGGRGRLQTVGDSGFFEADGGALLFD